jgi:hypothetical protein
MPYDGYNGIFTTLYNFITDAAGGLKILATRVQGQCADIATGLTTALTKDGQTTPTANLPMGSFKHTGVADASARTNYSSAAQVQDSSLNWVGTLTGTDTYTGTLTPAILSYATGAIFRALVTNANTGAVTINLNSLGAKSVKKNGSTALAAGDITASSLIEFCYDGTNFQLINIQNLASLAGATFTGNVVHPNTGLQIKDADASHNLSIIPTSNITAARNLNIATGDADRTLTLSGNLTASAAATVSGTNTGDVAAASQAEMEAASSNTVMVTPGVAKYHPGAAKAWALFTTVGTTTILHGFNVSSLTDRATGITTVNFTTAFYSADYAYSSTTSAENTLNSRPQVMNAIGVGSYDYAPTTSALTLFSTTGDSGSHYDNSYVSAIFFGDQ